MIQTATEVSRCSLRKQIQNAWSKFNLFVTKLLHFDTFGVLLQNSTALELDVTYCGRGFQFLDLPVPSTLVFLIDAMLNCIAIKLAGHIDRYTRDPCLIVNVLTAVNSCYPRFVKEKRF